MTSTTEQTETAQPAESATATRKKKANVAEQMEAAHKWKKTSSHC
jgi:hypothetical protein